MAGGVLRALTLAPGIAPLGIVFGATAVQAGFSPAGALALSALVFAGGAQFAAAGLALTGASALAIAALVALINSRYFLLSAAILDLARRHGATRGQRVLLALGVVDESYALQAAWAREREAPPETAPAADAAIAETAATRAPTTRTPRRRPLSLAGLLAVPVTLWLLWNASTVVGALVGERLPPLEPFGLDYALPGIFVGLLGIFAQTREHLIGGLVALVAGGALALAGYGTAAVLLVPPLLAFSLGRWRPLGDAAQ